MFAVVALAPYLLRGRKLPMLVVLSAGLAYACSGFMTKFVADAFSEGHILPGLAWLGGTAVAALIGLTSEMTALQKRSAIRVFPGVLVIQIVLAVLCAPLLAGEQWSTEPLAARRARRLPGRARRGHRRAGQRRRGGGGCGYFRLARA